MSLNTTFTPFIRWPRSTDTVVSPPIIYTQTLLPYPVTTVPVYTTSYTATLTLYSYSSTFSISATQSTVVYYRIPIQGVTDTPRRVEAEETASAVTFPVATTSHTAIAKTSSLTSAAISISSPPPLSSPSATSPLGPGSSTPSKTAPSSTESINPSAPAIHHGSSVSSGAAAGIGIGCTIIGAIIAALALLFLHRRKRPPHSYSKRIRHSDEKAGDAEVFPLTKVGTMASVDAVLPPPTQDSDIAGDMSKLGGVIKNHAQNFYDTRGGAIRDHTLENRMTALVGLNSPLSAKAILDLLADQNTMAGAIRFLVAWTILKNVVPSSSLDETLLPPAIVEQYSKMDAGNDLADRRLVSRWRQMTAMLLQNTFSHHAISSPDPREQNIRNLVTRLDDVLRHFAAQPKDEQRLQNLEELTKRAARFGYVLFSQPTDWKFDWTRGKAGQSGSIVVFPALVQTTDENARRNSPEKRCTEVQTMTAGGRA